MGVSNRLSWYNGHRLEERLTGTHETASIHHFSSGIANRLLSVFQILLQKKVTDILKIDAQEPMPIFIKFLLDY